MTRARERASPRLVLLAGIILLAGGLAVAENIDPANDGSKYAWAENLGWLNARPGGPGGPGVQLSDSDLTGWAWSENAGWISMACQNTVSCGTASYGVTNDGCGILTGYAWSENAGWISMSCQNTVSCGTASFGVTIDPVTGIFSGRAWSENAGWITFASAGPNPYRVATSWRRAVPAGPIALTVTKAGGSNVLLSWTTVAGATGYDVVPGGLLALHASHGNFQVATQPCIVANAPGPSFTTGGTPSAGDGYWFLVRGRNCGGKGTYGGVSEDSGIVASGQDCL